MSDVWLFILTHSYRLQEICRLLANSVERVCGGPAVLMYPQQNDSVNFHFDDSVEMRQLAFCCSELRHLAPSNGEGKAGISHVRVSSLISQVTLLADGTMRLPIPRYFFQTLQTTSIKLSVSPQPRVLGEPVSVPQGSQLALKVEGVLRHGRRASLFRSVAAVCISISTTPPSKINSDQKVNSQSVTSSMHSTRIIILQLFAGFQHKWITTNGNASSRFFRLRIFTLFRTSRARDSAVHVRCKYRYCCEWRSISNHSEREYTRQGRQRVEMRSAIHSSCQSTRGAGKTKDTLIKTTCSQLCIFISHTQINS